MTIVVVGDDRVLEQVRKQLGKVIPVVKVRDMLVEFCPLRLMVLKWQKRLP